MVRTILAAALIAAFGMTGITAASAKRSNDERKAFWRTVHESKQPWQDMMNKAGVGNGTATAPAGATGASVPKAAKPAR